MEKSLTTTIFNSTLSTVLDNATTISFCEIPYKRESRPLQLKTSPEDFAFKSFSDNFLLSPELYYKIGAALAVLGNFVIAVSLNVQKYAHRKRESQFGSNNSESNKSFCAPGSYLRSGTWWIGIVLMVFGEIGNFVAYGFAPASVVAPLGCVAVLANGVLAVIFNQEVLRMQDIVGASFAIVGGFLIIQFSKQTDVIMNASQIVHHLGGWQFIIYVFVEVITFGLIIFLRSYTHYENYGVTLQLILVAVLGSFTVISAKAVSGMLALTIQGNSQLIYAIFYVMLAVMIITTLLQVKYLNEAMAKYDIATVVPVNFVLFTISAILAGAIFYQEFFDRSGITIIMFLFGCFLSFAGVFFLTSDKNKLGHEATSLHMDMMPNFIRSLAPSFKTLNVQPQANSSQVMSYPEDLPLIRSRSSSCTKSQYNVSTGKVEIPALLKKEAELSSNDFTDWDDSDGEQSSK